MEYTITHSINDKTIHIQVIHNKNYYETAKFSNQKFENYYPNLNQKIKDFLVYETNISNNDTNQNILKDNKFTYHHVGNKLIMINNDTTFQLDKMECNYYDYMEMKKELEQLKNKLNNKKKIYGTNFERVDCRRYDFQGMDLSNYNFSDADLRGCDLSNIRLINSNLSGARLDKANLRDCDLTGAYAGGSISCINTIFINANLTGIKMIGAKFNDADFTVAKLINAELNGPNLTNTNFTNGDLSGIKINADGDYRNLINVNFTNANLSKGDFSRCYINYGNFTNANLTNANLTNAHLNTSNLTNANLDQVIGYSK